MRMIYNHNGILVLLVIITLSFHLNGQEYFDGKLILRDGSEKIGLIRHFNSMDTKIRFKDNFDSKRIKIKSEELSEIIIYDELDTLQFLNYYRARYNNKGTKLRYFNGNCWALKIYESDQIEAFRYAIEKTDVPFLLDLSQVYGENNFLSFGFRERYKTYGIRFPEDEAIVDILITKRAAKALENNRFRKRIIKYLRRKCRAFYKANQRKEFDEIDDFIELLELYSNICR